ncbi:glycosyl hydrolase, family 88 [Sphingobacterium spiritivorum ATCC 33300]|uniref:Glycosyl hydrolase, family 88 n=1 Tax=Sphingobacterium spiritivorum ATCC 33300 TaxID=525372 RepID=C2G555_SPHSI|nr:glycoside hydrolase family 88 protein [Sphingobacterium spiritivorum]EEI89806.1 glycosyl hydrolase, family 88 [Sphingobacterium spiritivorum ATCC 33300]QQS94678.1 glycoside hydrolase family 88 protein [Sphingobacterium spiritivorum]
MTLLFKVTALSMLAVTLACSSTSGNFVAKDFERAEEQYTVLLNNSKDITIFPRTLDSAGNVKGTDVWDWTGGFFAGSLWNIYEYSKDPKWEATAIKWTEALEEGKFLTQHHDIGFVMYCSYGNAIKNLKDTAKINAYNKILIQSGESALTRFNPKVGLIKSWNSKMSWDKKTLWNYPVIIDNMMNLEMLFYVSKLTGDDKYKKVAISHADQTMKYHFRPDYSTYHVVDYDTTSGKVLHQQTNQGFADNSTWSRGQAWAVYGYTVMYRETKDPKYLTTAEHAADFFLNHANLPEDKIPYWDFNVNQEGYKPDWAYDSKRFDVIRRDASAAAVIASALLELSGYAQEKGKAYLNAAEQILKALSSDEYLAKKGTNGGFLLLHSVGSMPHNSEIDVPLTYADYYFLEALNRYRELKK